MPKISDLPSATALGGSELVAVVQGGVTKQSTVADIWANATLATFTTNGSGAATVAATVGKTVYVWEFDADGAGTLLGTNLYSFNSGTGAFTGLGASTQYLVIYTI